MHIWSGRMLTITNYNFNEQVSAIANDTVTDGIIDFNLKQSLTAEQLVTLEEALKQNNKKQWGFKISRDTPLDARAQLLQSLPKLCSQISYLNIEPPALTENDVAALENIITQNKTALHLELVLDKTIPTNGFLEVLKKVKSSKTLTELIIYNTEFSNATRDQLLNSIAGFLRENVSLRELSIFDLNLDEGNIDLLASALTNNYSIEQINYWIEYIGPIEELLARNKAMAPLFQSLKDDLDNNTFYPIPLNFHEHTKLLTDDERAALIHQLERSKHPLAPLTCAYLLFPETSFYNFVANFIDESSPTDEAKSHAAVTFLFQASSNPQFKGLADTMLYYLKAGSPFESIKNRLSTFYINPDKRYTRMEYASDLLDEISYSPDSFMNDREPTAMPAIPLDPPTPTNPSSFFAQNRNTPTISADDEENDQNKSRAP